jgi:predicted  nucleic acid-binding Zn-ribbon protein
MSDLIDKLLTVQDIDVRIREIEKELEDIPARKEQELTRLHEHKDALAEAEEKLKAAQAEVNRLELETSSRNEKINKLRQQQFELKTNEQFKAMDAEIEGVKAEISKIEDQELALMDEVEEARKFVTEKSGALKEEEEAVETDIKVFDERASELEQEIESCRAEREEAAEGMNPEWMSYYVRVMEHRKDRALVPLESGVCGGCHMTLPPSLHHATRRRDEEMVVCNYCGRLLYCEM